MASLTWSSLYGSPMSLSYQGSTLSSSRSSCSSLQVLCQQSTVDISEQISEKVPRRSFAVATLLAVLVESYSAQKAQAARKKPVETAEKKPEEDKSLSAYDAKLLATYRRKEAMKEALAKQRAKAKPTQKPAAVEPRPVAKSESEAIPKAQPETPAASVAASATEAVESVLPSSDALSSPFLRGLEWYQSLAFSCIQQSYKCIKMESISLLASIASTTMEMNQEQSGVDISIIRSRLCHRFGAETTKHSYFSEVCTVCGRSRFSTSS